MSWCQQQRIRHQHTSSRQALAAPRLWMIVVLPQEIFTRCFATNFVFADVVLQPISLQLKQQIARRHRSRMRQKISTAVAVEPPDYWKLSPGMEQKITSTISDDQQAVVTYTMRVWLWNSGGCGCACAWLLGVAAAAAIVCVSGRLYA